MSNDSYDSIVIPDDIMAACCSKPTLWPSDEEIACMRTAAARIRDGVTWHEQRLELFGPFGFEDTHSVWALQDPARNIVVKYFHTSSLVDFPERAIPTLLLHATSPVSAVVLQPKAWAPPANNIAARRKLERLAPHAGSDSGAFGTDHHPGNRGVWAGQLVAIDW